MKKFILEADAVFEAQNLSDAFTILAFHFHALARGHKSLLRPLLHGELKVEELRSAYYNCWSCGLWHPDGWDGDCRDDANRFSAWDLDNKHGMNEWDEVLADDQT